jgi:ABC-type transport system involved in multi-copper enzyme maturation permease subunit
VRAILERELLSLLRSRKAFAIQAGVALMCSLLIIMRWPEGARVDLAGERSREVLVVFGYGLLTCLMLLVPGFPATNIVREKQQHTLLLLVHSPLKPMTIYFGKLASTLGFVLILMALSLPAAAACYAMGGVSVGELSALYGVLIVVALQYGTLGLFISSRSRSTDAALRVTYGAVLALAIFCVVPYLFLRGTEGPGAMIADKLRCVSPIPAVMELLGHSDVGQRGFTSNSGAPKYYIAFALIGIVGFSVATIRRLHHGIFDKARSQGVVTDDLTGFPRLLRRLVFIVDPQRRKAEIGPFTNPVMVKEFRCRQFGRLHWLLRLIAACALTSLLLTYATTLGSTDWGAEKIGGIIVVMQVALIVFLTPGLAGGLISGEHESGSWKLLRMTPMSAGVILRGKLLSVMWTMLLILCATLPGYLVMIRINPLITEQVRQVVICLVLTAVFAIMLSITVSSFFRRSAPATATAYGLLLFVCVGTLLAWLGRDAPFGHSTVNAVLTINPMAAALSVIKTPGFADYQLVPANWWIMSGASVVLFIVLALRVRVLIRAN